MTAPVQPPETKTIEYHRLSMESYAQLEKKLPAPMVHEGTTAHQAGFLLGIQFVMTQLRDGYRIG